jgi:hypothetical protein
MPLDTDLKFIVPRSPSGSFDDTLPEHWDYFLERINQTGCGIPHVKNSAVLLAQIGKGFRWTLQKWAERTPEYQKPMIGVEDTRLPLKLNTAVCYNSIANVIGVSPTFLSKIAAQPLGDTLRFTNPKGAPNEGEEMFVGSNLDFYFLAGVEEGDHSIWMHKHPEDKERGLSHVGELTTAQYLAQDHEFHALQEQLAAGEQLSMPRVTIAVMRKKLEAALAVRQSS